MAPHFGTVLHAIVLLGLAVNVLSLPADLTLRGSLLQCLQIGLSSAAVVELPGMTGFVEDSTRYSVLDAPTFRAVVRVASEADIATCITCANQYNIPFLATSARHGYSTSLTSIHNGLEIYTGYLNQINVNAATNRLTVGGAVRFQQAVDVLYASGKEIPTGSCACVGFLGATLGGGVGRLSGLHGLVMDSLLSVRIMLANTTIVVVSQSENPDLFYGIRGAGFNFGIVLEATYQIYDQVPRGLHLNADFIFPVSQAKDYFKALKKKSKNLEKELSVITYVVFDPASNQTIILANAVYAGPETSGRIAVQFLIDQNPLVQNITAVPWNKLIAAAAFGPTPAAICDRGFRQSQWGVGLKKIDVDAYLDAIALYQEMVAAYPASAASALDIQLLPNDGIRTVPDGETAYPWRSHIGQSLLTFVYADNSTDDSTGYPRRIRDRLAHGAGTGSELQVYVSYSHGDEGLESVYGNKQRIKRLARIKRAVDPEEKFSAYHPVPLVYP